MTSTNHPTATTTPPKSTEAKVVALDRNRWPLSVGIAGRFHRNAQDIDAIQTEGVLVYHAVNTTITGLAKGAPSVLQ